MNRYVSYGTCKVSLAASIRCLTMSTRARAATDWAELPSALGDTECEVARGDESDFFYRFIGEKWNLNMRSMKTAFSEWLVEGRMTAENRLDGQMRSTNTNASGKAMQYSSFNAVCREAKSRVFGFFCTPGTCSSRCKIPPTVPRRDRASSRTRFVSRTARGTRRSALLLSSSKLEVMSSVNIKSNNKAQV